MTKKKQTNKKQKKKKTQKKKTKLIFFHRLDVSLCVKNCEPEQMITHRGVARILEKVGQNSLDRKPYSLIESRDFIAVVKLE